MGNTETLVFTHHKRYNNKARKTVSVIHKVLQDIFNEQSFSILVPGLSPRPTPELEAMQKQKNNYLDRYLNLQHYLEIELTEKWMTTWSELKQQYPV